MLGLAAILLLGIGAQWLAWRLRIPSILLLLLVGFAVGPLTNQELLDPDTLLGDALQPFVSLAVALVLFEGGLTLRLRELRGAGRAVLALVVLGPILTLGFVALSAHYVLDFGWAPSALLGAILVVTGPTVIGPLLRHVRPTGSAGQVVRWEGIVTDPIGAIVAVLIFQGFLQGDTSSGGVAMTGLLKGLLAGGGLGSIGGLGVVFLLRRGWIPDFLHAPATLAFALAAFVGADHIQHESGLAAVTWMGMLLANQSRVVIEHIVEFKENLRVILVSTLFILLAARLPLEEFTQLDGRSVVFVVILILVIRPAVVFLSTPFSGLSLAEKTFVSWMAPRGIVAAAVASVFALELDVERFPEAQRLVPVVFFVILATVAVYGLTAAPLARRLGISRGSPEGILFVGAHYWARAIARALRDCGVDVLMVDTKHHDVQAARMDGLQAHFGNAVSEDFVEQAPLESIGHLVCLTSNDHVNALACLHFAPSLGRGNVHQLVPDEDDPEDEVLPAHLRGQALLGEDLDYWTLEARFRAGAQVKRTNLTDEFGLSDFHQVHDVEGAPAIPLMRVAPDGTVELRAADREFAPKSGDVLIAIVTPSEP